MKFVWLLGIIIFLITAQVQAVQLSGVTDFSARASLAFSESGMIQQIEAKPGDRVEKNESLASLNPLIFRNSLLKFRAVSNTLKPLLEQKSSELDKANELFDRDALARVELEVAEQQYTIAKANLDAALADVQIAEYRLSQSELRAPFAGLVTRVDAVVGEYYDRESHHRTLIEVVNNQQMVATAFINSDLWHSDLNNRFAKVKYRGSEYSGAVVYVSDERKEQNGAVPAFELKVLFTANGDIPANMPVTIDIQE